MTTVPGEANLRGLGFMSRICQKIVKLECGTGRASEDANKRGPSFPRQQGKMGHPIHSN
jgi:hypothetical protein